MAVAHDVNSTLQNSTLSGGTKTLTSFMTLGGTATFLLVGVDINATSPGALTVTWAGQSMTSLGAYVVTTGGTNSNMQLFGLVSPTTGAQSLVVSVSGGTTDTFYVFGISFTGTATASVAAATTAYTTNTGTTSPMTATSSSSIPSTGMIVGFGAEQGGGFNSAGEAFFTSGTQIGQDQNLNSNDNAAYATGTGSAMTGSAVLLTPTAWSMILVGIVAPSGDTLGNAMQRLFM